MTQPKAQTIQQRFGFVDSDLKSPNHDVIMTWLDTTAEINIKNITAWRGRWPETEIKKQVDRANNLVDEWNKHHPLDIKKGWSLGDPPDKPNIKTRQRWEYTISSGKFIIGFVDMLISYTSPYLSLDNVFSYGYSNNEYLKYDCPCWQVENYSEDYILFEVKTSIPSLGELIRQVRMYQEYIKAPFYIVAPDDKFAEQLCSQGIGFVRYPDGKIYKP